MNPIRTLRARFALWLTVLILAFLSAFGGYVYVSQHRSAYNAVDDALMLGAEQVLAALYEDDGSILMPLPDPNAPDLVEFIALAERGLTLRVLASNGEVLQAIGLFSHEPLPVPLPTQPAFHTIPEANEVDRIRVYTIPILENNQIIGWVQTAQSLANAEDSLDRLRTALLVGVGALSLLAGFAGYFLAARALAPIDKITATARRISAEDLSARLNLPDHGDEVSRLADTFDDMLARIENGFARERQFTADASHELRTPLTAMQTILDFMRAGERPAAEYRQALDDISEEADRLQNLVEGLLILARGEGNLKLQEDEIDLTLLLADLTDSLRPLAEAKRLSLTFERPPSIRLFADPDALIRLFVNLLDNAIKYTERGGIIVSAGEEEGDAVVEIADTGIGIPAEHLPHIFERFYRVDASRSSRGAGLGLAIAAQIVQGHRGRLEVQSEAGKGTRFTVHLPK
ncbi:MAG: ATP-binding protein [Anaerolineales bacterium]|nr:ATP-binding protein [Anaerolineales bacterium]